MFSDPQAQGAAYGQQLPGVSTGADPGGNAQKSLDPFGYEISVCINCLERLSQDLKASGDEAFGNEISMVANRITRRKLAREKEIQNASSKGLTNLNVMSQQL